MTGNVSQNRPKKSMSTGAKIAIVGGSLVVVMIFVAVVAGFFIATPALNFFRNNTVKVDEKTNSVEVTTQDGQGTFSSKSELPENYPSDIPVYANSEVVYSVVKNGEGSNVTWRTSDSLQQVVDFYETQLAANAWSKTRGQATYFNSGIGFAEKDKRGLSLIVTSENRDGQASTVIVITEKAGQ